MNTAHATAIQPKASSSLSANGASFLKAPLQFLYTGDAKLAWRSVGQGPALLLVHGFPFHGFGWRHVIAGLSRHYTCYVPDLAGLGETVWQAQTCFGFEDHARRLQQLVEHLGLKQYDVLAHDTGATVTRCLAGIDAQRLRRMALINTEMPGHRPPWIQEFQFLTRLPGSGWSFRQMLRPRVLRRSGMLFGGCFGNMDLIDGEFHEQFVLPLINSATRTEGALHYLNGIDWSIVDSMERRHREMQQQVLLIWGADDPIFPIGLARQMAGQFANGRGLVEIAACKVLPHEEKPEEVIAAVLAFLSAP